MKLKNKFELNKGLIGLFGWFYIISIILTICLFTLNLTSLFFNPSKLNNINEGDNIFLGFYNLHISSSSNTLTLSWASYVSGILLIALTIINCLIYFLPIRANINYLISTRTLMLLTIVSTISALCLFILNIFNKPMIDYVNQDFINNGWDTNIAQKELVTRINFVYDILFISNGTNLLASEISLNEFSAIWIIFIIISLLSYFILIGIFSYYKQVKVIPIFRKD